MNLARTTQETIHGNPGERRVLPANTLVAVTTAFDLPADSPIKYWASPVNGHPWPEETQAWARDVGVGLGVEDLTVQSVALTDEQQQAVRRFIDCWNLSMPYHDIGSALNCGECNALRDLLMACGDADAARALMEAHVVGDDEGDDPEHLQLRNRLETGS